ncbi:hypothetical protein PENTCL1PPCAC_27066, partial [Pristionchus entomophagus]
IVRMKLGDVIPDFHCDTDRGRIDSFHDWIGEGKWAILFSHPADFTPVCTTELARAAQLAPEFDKRGVKLIALSIDSAVSHRAWIADIAGYCAYGEVDKDNFPFPIIADESRYLSEALGMIDPDEINASGVPLSARAVLVIGPDKKLKLQILYPATTGRNFDEILRVVDSLLLTAKHKVATPADWKVGNVVMIQPSLPQDEALLLFPRMAIMDMPSGIEYLRLTPIPDDFSFVSSSDSSSHPPPP